MRKSKLKYLFATISIIIVLLGLFAFAPTFLVSGAESPGGNLLIGDVSGGTVGAASFEDEDGNTYQVRLIASEYDGSGGGQVTMLLDGGPVRFCSARGSDAEINFDTVVDCDNPFECDFEGNQPLYDVSCGTAYEMAVDIDGCQAEIELHGYVHSDYPSVNYMGMMTSYVKVKTEAQDQEIEIEIFTPKDEIKLKGEVSGNVYIDTCP